MKHLVALTAFFLVTAYSAQLRATSYSTDQSDLWYIPAESGWGIQFVQRDSLIFATMFVYDQSGSPTWFVATMSPTSAGLAWSGDLYLTHGPYFGTQPYNLAAFGGAIVGNMTWTPQTVATGVLTYSVNGIAVAKAIIRQPLVNENYNGRFAGGIHTDYAACPVPANDVTVETQAQIAIAQNVSALSISVQTATDTCVYVGSLSQEGQLGEVLGTFTCTSGEHGNMDMLELQVTQSAISGRFTATDAVAACQRSGWFAAARSTLF